METIYTPPANGSAGSYTLTTTLDESFREASRVITQAPVRTRKIAIVGFGRTAADAPWKDDSWEIWAMNGWHRAAKPDFGVEVPEERYALWFDMHTIEYTRAYGKMARIEGLQEDWLRQPHPYPILSIQAAPEWPSVHPYPIAAAVEWLGRDYFTSSIAYAICFAAMQADVAEIGLWGIDLVHDTEYSDQRPCAEYHIRAAEDAGITVTIHERSALLKQRARYGYAVEDELSRDMRALLTSQIEGLEKTMAANQTELERLRGQLHTDDGALQSCRGMLQRLNIYDRGGQV